MKKKCIFLFLFSILLACKNERHNSLQFLDEYILKDSLSFKNSIVGGISGIDYANGYYYLVVDDAEKPRFFKTEIKINKNKIDTLIIKDVIYLKDSLQPFFKENHLDLESIFINKNQINFSSEGAITNNKRPSIFTTDFKGNFIEEYQLPKPFLNLENIVNNGVFEGSALSYHKKGLWSIMEAPLKKDGVEATFTKTQSPVRITYFNHKTKKATKQFAYQLEKITKPAKGNINLSGVTAILEHKENTFFVVERTYQSNYGAYGNIVRIFEAEITPATTNILALNALKDAKYSTLKKKLLLNLEDIKEHLTEKIIDNIEGITLGPVLENGNPSLLLVSDNNFQKYGKQLNQFILLEIVEE